MKKVFGIDLGTTYSCISYIDDFGKPSVAKNSEGERITPSVVFFESDREVTVGAAAKESSKLYPDKVVSFIKRSIGQPGFSLNINGVDMTPEEISSYILKKIVKDANETLCSEGVLGAGEAINDVVITCPAYFGVAERDATAAAGKIAGLNVLSIINEPTAAAITYGVTGEAKNKTVLVYDLGGGTFDVTMINVTEGEIKVICTGGDHNLGGKDWDDRVLMYLADAYQSETGTPDNILEDAETFQELCLASEKAKKLLSSKETAPVPINYGGERARIELTRAKFDELTEDLLTRTVDLTRDMFREAEKKGYKISDVSEILLVGGSTRMPQVSARLEREFGIPLRAFDPDEAVAKGAAIYAAKVDEYNEFVQKAAQKTGTSVQKIKEDLDSGKTDVQQLAKKANIDTGRTKQLPGGNIKITNVSSRSFGTLLHIKQCGDELRLCNIIFRNAELPAYCNYRCYPHTDNQKIVRFKVMENLSTESQIMPELGKEIGFADLQLPPGTTKDTPLELTFKLNESGLLELFAIEKKSGKTVESTFQTIAALSADEIDAATKRSQQTNIN